MSTGAKIAAELGIPIDDEADAPAEVKFTQAVSDIESVIVAAEFPSEHDKSVALHALYFLQDSITQLKRELEQSAECFDGDPLEYAA